MDARSVFAGLLAFTMLAAQAGPASQPSGAQLTQPGTGFGRFERYPTGNPASPAASEPGISFGLLSSFGGGLEVGAAEDFDSRIDDIIDAFEELEQELAFLTPGMMTAVEINDLIDRINGFETQANTLVADLAEDGYFKFNAGLIGPGAPLSFGALGVGGVVTLSYDGFAEFRAGLVATDDAFSFGLQDVIYQPGQSFDVVDDNDRLVVVIDGEEFEFRASENAGVAIQGAVVGRVSGGYSRPVWSNNLGQLYAGGQLHMYRVTTARVGRLLDDDESAIDEADDVLDENQRKSNGFGIDAGLLWVADAYQLGLTLRNLNEPSFSYPDACNGGDEQTCAFYTANPGAARNGSSWTMERQATVSGALHNERQTWLLTAALDLNSVVDSTGDDYQWLAAGLAYQPLRGWVPSPRVGLRRNLAGEELSYVSVGVSLFRILHIDYSQALDSTRFDGDSIPRAMQLNAGLYFEF